MALDDPDALGAERLAWGHVLVVPRVECCTQRSTTRIDRTACKVLISRDFVRAVLSQGIDRQWTVTDRSS